MRKIKSTRVQLLTVAFLCILFSNLLVAQENTTEITFPDCREHLLMDFGWRFAFGHAYDVSKDFNHATAYFSYLTKTGFGDGPASPLFDDRAWRELDLPHDWAVELPFDTKASYSHGYKTVGRNFPETSIGWYRKTYLIPQTDLGRRITIQFDGVHRDSRVFVNGFYLGEQHSGYYGFEYDITDYLNYGGENVVSVRVDATMEEGWYYEGAGIYRHVWLNKTDPLHISKYGIFVTTEVKEDTAYVKICTTVINEGKEIGNFTLRHAIIEPYGHRASDCNLRKCNLKAGEEKEFSDLHFIEEPTLWSIETPRLYKLITKIMVEDSVIDKCETYFGIRTLLFDAEKGFFLNGEHVLLKGTNNHQDHAGVGTAIPDALQEFRIRKLKEMGSNAYRCSHNPPTPEVLDICDRLGMLVIDENRLLGTNEEHLSLLENMIKRDRNHPSVMIWSIGNEEWAVEGNITGARIATTMQNFVMRLDSTRRVTYAHSGWGDNGIGLVQDVMGFNYIFNGDIDRQHLRCPNQPAIGTEETTSRSTRGIYKDDPQNGYIAQTDRKPGGRSLEDGYKFYTARPWLSGLFYWTGFDHRGEPGPFGYPQVGSHSGILDQCGFPKDMFYYLKSLWTTEPTLHIFPHWNWFGNEGDTINVWAYSNCDEVELFLNDNSLGKKAMPVNSHLEWNVIYKPSKLIARGYKNGKEIVTDSVETFDNSALIKLIPDKPTIKADGEDVSVITVQINDANNKFVATASDEITFSLQGPGKIIGIGNGDPSSHDNDRFIENVSQVYITNLKAQVMKEKSEYPETGIDFDDSDWKSALNEQGNYNVRAKEENKNMVIRGSFELKVLSNNTEVILYPKSLGETQNVFVNGHLIARNIKRGDAVQEFKLDNSILRNGTNVYSIVGTPLVERFLYDNLNTDPGIIKVTKPAGQWKRKAFNGLAQVIVQSTQESGEIILTAESEGLQKAEIRLTTTPVKLRPSVSKN